MKEQYEARIKAYQKSAREYELKAEQEMKTGSGSVAMEYCRLADMDKINATNWQIALDGMK